MFSRGRFVLLPNGRYGQTDQGTNRPTNGQTPAAINNQFTIQLLNPPINAGGSSRRRGRNPASNVNWWWNMDKTPTPAATAADSVTATGSDNHNRVTATACTHPQRTVVDSATVSYSHSASLVRRHNTNDARSPVSRHEKKERKKKANG